MSELQQTIRNFGKFRTVATPFFTCLFCFACGIATATIILAKHRGNEFQDALNLCARTHNVYECQLVAVPVTDEKGE